MARLSKQETQRLPMVTPQQQLSSMQIHVKIKSIGLHEARRVSRALWGIGFAQAPESCGDRLPTPLLLTLRFAFVIPRRGEGPQGPRARRAYFAGAIGHAAQEPAKAFP